MKELVFILMVLNGQEVEGEMVHPNMDKCKWYAGQINRESDRLAGPYSAWCKPVVRNKVEE